MDWPKRDVGSFLLPFLLLFGFVYSYFWLPSAFFYFPSFPRHTAFSNTTNISEDGLETVLMRASMENKTLIITVVNRAYAENGSILDLFLHSFRLGADTQFLLNHLLLVTVDQTSFDRCKLLHRHCYKLVTDDVDFSGEKVYMSAEFIKMMWRRTQFLAEVLRLGYSFIFTDTDVMWIRNPFSRLGHDRGDLQISCDFFNGHPSDQSNPINTGFYFVASSAKTISLFEMWHANGIWNESVGLKEQDVLDRLIHRKIFQRLDMKVRILDTRYFGGFCQSSRDFSLITTVHANCCRTIKAKRIDLTALLEGWKNFTTPFFDISTIRWPAHKACAYSWTN